MLKLYPFQQYVVDRFKEIRSVLIGDEMGIGKTIEAIALDLERRKAYAGELKTLIVTPLAVTLSWERHYNKWAPHLTTIRINNRRRSLFLESLEIGEHDVYICHWDALRLMPELTDHQWFHVIGDEIHKIQNHKTAVSKSLKAIPGTFKTGLSGTPAYDKPDDLWSVLNWLYPSFWTSYWNYFNRYVLWVDYNGYKQVIGVANQEELQNQMRGFYIRRKKDEVIHDLPEKTFTQIFVDLTPKQRRAYNQMRDSMLSWIGENEDKPLNASAVVSQLIRLQQFASAHATINDDNKMILSDPSSKIDAAIELLYSTNKQIVFFSQFTQVINLFCDRLKKNKITFGKYTGETSNKEREKTVQDFIDGKIRVFAGNVGAGGTGLDGLQVADTIVFFDRPWSQSVFQQAVGRLDRIGQKNNIQIIDLIAAGTIERKRMEKIQMEWGWVKALLGEDDEL